MKEIIEQAIKNKNEDIKQYVWKGKKTRTETGKVLQNEIRLVDATEAALNEYYAHCMSMLHNPDKNNPGRYEVLKLIKEQREKCNCELFLRWLGTEKNISKYSFQATIRSVLDQNPHLQMESLTVDELAGGVPEEYAQLPVTLVMDGCLDTLGKFYKKHITLSFILKQGIWFTSAETKELTEKDEDGNDRNKMDVVKERVGLDKDVVLHATPRGLSFTQFKAMIKLRSNKYSELSTTQLQTLRDRMLFVLEDDVNYHIKQWKERIDQIRKVADYKGIKLSAII